MQLPLNLSTSQMQTRWKSILDPVLANPLLQGRLISNISLVPGDNVINHKLGRAQIGWIVTDNNEGDIDLYRDAPFNDLTLTLNCDTPAIISLWVF
jgi:hypothetical protein